MSHHQNEGHPAQPGAAPAAQDVENHAAMDAEREDEVAQPDQNRSARKR